MHEHVSLPVMRVLSSDAAEILRAVTRRSSPRDAGTWDCAEAAEPVANAAQGS